MAKINENDIFVFRTETEPNTIIMIFGVLILKVLIKSSSVKMERLRRNCRDSSVLKVNTLIEITSFGDNLRKVKSFTRLLDSLNIDLK